MSSENPYAPPDSDVTVSDPVDLASRGARLGGAIIDTIIAMTIIFPAMIVSGYWERAMAGDSAAADAVLLGVLGMVGFLVLNGYLLAKHGQTIGKRLVKTRIVSFADDQILSFGKVIGLRYVPVWVASQIPGIGAILGLVDTLFIFRKDRRCIHDLIAGTRVVTADTA